MGDSPQGFQSNDKSLNLSDSIALVAIVIAILLWIIFPDVPAKIVATVFMLIALGYLAMRSAWTVKLAPILRSSIGLILVIGTGLICGFDIKRQWSEEEQSHRTTEVAKVVAPPVVAPPVVAPLLPTIKKSHLPPITLASHRFLIKPFENGYNAELQIYLNNNTGALLKTWDRSVTGMFPVPINSPRREELEEDLWTQMSKQAGKLREFPTTPEMSKTFPLSEMPEQALRQAQDGTIVLVFMVSIRSADDKKRLFELCGYVNGPNELWYCNKHNWP